MPLRSRGRELALAAFAFGVLSALVYWPHLRGGGFYLDDWLLASQVQQPPTGMGVVEHLNTYGPAQYHALSPWIYGAAWGTLGEHESWHIALWIGVGALAMTAFFAALRAAGRSVATAGAAAALVLLFPFATSSRLWPAASVSLLAAVPLWTGVALALHGLRRRDVRSSVAWHAGALACYLLAVVIYELAAGTVVVAATLYLFRATPRAALPRWLADLAVTAVGLLVVRATIPTEPSDASLWDDNARELVNQVPTLLARVAWPFGDATAPVLVVLAVTFGLGLWRRRAATEEMRERYSSALLLGLAGLAVTAAGAGMITPAAPEYTVLGVGFENRINAFSGYGIVLLLVATALILGALAAEALRGRRPARVVVPAVATVALLPIGIAWLEDSRDQMGDWGAAKDVQREAIGGLLAALPQPPANGTTVYMTGHPIYAAPGAPVFTWVFDVNGIVRLLYDDATLNGYPVLPGTTWRCEPTQVAALWPKNEAFPARVVPAPYGRTVVVDVKRRTATPMNSQRECERVTRSVRPGPEYGRSL